MSQGLYDWYESNRPVKYGVPVSYRPYIDEDAQRAYSDLLRSIQQSQVTDKFDPCWSGHTAGEVIEVGFGDNRSVYANCTMCRIRMYLPRTPSVPLKGLHRLVEGLMEEADASAWLQDLVGLEEQVDVLEQAYEEARTLLRVAKELVAKKTARTA